MLPTGDLSVSVSMGHFSLCSCFSIFALLFPRQLETKFPNVIGRIPKDGRFPGKLGLVVSLLGLEDDIASCASSWNKGC